MKKYNKIVGSWGEDLAVSFLQKRGYKILKRNIKLGYQEIDILALFKNKIIFVEVKTRTNKIFGRALEQISILKYKNLKKAINRYCLRNKIDLDEIELEFIAIDFDTKTKIAKIYHEKKLL